ENLAGGFDDAYMIVNILLLDQYTPSYGHRKNILSRKFSRIGVAIREHPVYTYICVQDFSDAAGDKK
ncbi:MAG: CAP domain-containing protein, partial [Bacteroidales bacterium]|nr:CAP domain-containing protein [Bacteroidales bacterium]